MSEDWELKICCMGAGYVGGPTMAVIAKQCPKVSRSLVGMSRRDIVPHNDFDHIWYRIIWMGHFWFSVNTREP